MKRSSRYIALAILAVLVLGACGEAAEPADSASEANATPRPEYGPEAGQLVYVPVYSHIFYRSAQRQMNLTATLSIRNADLRRPLDVRRVDYYDSQGVLVRQYLDAPISIAPLSSRAFVVEEDDIRGGVGANFIVEWASEDPVVTPVIQAVMITTASTQGISFVTEGYPLPDFAVDEPAEAD